MCNAANLKDCVRYKKRDFFLFIIIINKRETEKFFIICVRKP